MQKDVIHIGHEIERVMREKRVTQVEFAKRIGIAQSNVRRLLERASIETDKLDKIGRALEYNFFECYTAKGGENLSTPGDGVEKSCRAAAVPSDVAAAYLKGKRDGYDEALALMGGTESKENKKQAV